MALGVARQKLGFEVIFDQLALTETLEVICFLVFVLLFWFFLILAETHP